MTKQKVVDFGLGKKPSQDDGVFQKGVNCPPLYTKAELERQKKRKEIMDSCLTNIDLSKPVEPDLLVLLLGDIADNQLLCLTGANRMENGLLENWKVKAYVLYVYHWHRSTGSMEHYKSEMQMWEDREKDNPEGEGYRNAQRSLEDIQELENFRRELHNEAVAFLVSNGIGENEAKKVLEEEREKFVKNARDKEDLSRLNACGKWETTKREILEKDECYCGCCKVKLKVNDWNKHCISELHLKIAPYILALCTSPILMDAGAKYRLELAKLELEDLQSGEVVE